MWHILGVGHIFVNDALNNLAIMAPKVMYDAIMPNGDRYAKWHHTKRHYVKRGRPLKNTTWIFLRKYLGDSIRNSSKIVLDTFQERPKCTRILSDDSFNDFPRTSSETPV